MNKARMQCDIYRQKQSKVHQGRGRGSREGLTELMREQNIQEARSQRRV